MRARLGEQIRGLRLEQGLRLADVAALSGLSEPHLSRLEHGQRWPSLPVLLSLSRIYGVDASVLLWGPAAPPLIATHEASARWDGSEVAGKGVMTGRSGRVPFDRESRLAMTDDSSNGKPKRKAKTGSPEELVGMALAGSYSMALARQLESAGYEPRSVDTSAEVQLAVSAAGHAISEIRLRAVADVGGIDAATLDGIAQTTKRMCVVGRALVGVSVTLDARLASQ